MKKGKTDTQVFFFPPIFHYFFSQLELYALLLSEPETRSASKPRQDLLFFLLTYNTTFF